MGKKTGELIRFARTGAKLTQTALKAIARATGVTQASLLNAEKAARPAPKAETGDMKLSAAEKKLVKLFRAAGDDQKSDVLRILNGEKTEVEQLVDSLLGPKWKKKVRR